MPADLLNDRVIEMARVAQEVSRDVVGMLEALEDVVGDHGELATLPQLVPDVLALEVDVLHPAMVVVGRRRGDVLLEHDNVRVRHRLCVGGREERSDALMDGLGAEGWGR